MSEITINGITVPCEFTTHRYQIDRQRYAEDITARIEGESISLNVGDMVKCAFTLNGEQHSDVPALVGSRLDSSYILRMSRWL